MKYYLKELIYFITRSTMKLGYAFTFRKVITTGYSRVKKQKPAIFVANHQNTFIDGVVMVYTSGISCPNILVRADIFKSKWAYSALSSIRLMPIYRRRDGIGSVSQNDQIFDQCYEIFGRKGVVALFPEGNHAFPRHLRTLQKGAARIAFQAEEENNWQLNLSLIPVGIHYENQTARWHDVHIHYGEATAISDFKGIYEANPQKALKQTTDHVREGISSEMIDIEWEAEIEFFEQLRSLLKPEFKSMSANFKSLVHAENDAIGKLSTRIQADNALKLTLKESVHSVYNNFKKNGINMYYELNKPNFLRLLLRTILFCCLSPFYLLYKIITAIPEFVIEKIAIKKVKDKTWHLSLRFAISAFLYPIYFALVWLVLTLSIGWLQSSIIVCTFPLVSVVGLEVKHLFYNLSNGWKLIKHKNLAKSRRKLADDILNLYK